MRGRHSGCDVPRYMLLHEHVVRLRLSHKVVGPDAQWVMDSTPMWCFGAVLDTFRLLGDGLRMLATDWARATLTTLNAVAVHWSAPHLTAPSTKGAFAIDWKDKAARAAAIDQMATTALRCVEIVTSDVATARAGFKKRLLRKCRQLLKVVADDLELDAEVGQSTRRRKLSSRELGRRV